MRHATPDRLGSNNDPSLTIWLKIGLAIVGVTYALNFLVFGGRIGPFDYNHLSAYYELAWRFWLTGGTMPQYNPFFCGGRTLGADPQVPIFHPLLALVPLLGPTRLIKLEMLGQLALGIYGLVLWLRYFGVGRTQTLWGILLFAAGGGVVSRFMVGHVTLGFYFLLPLFFYLSYRLGEETGKRRLQLFAAYAALAIYCGLYKPNFLIYLVPPLFVEAAYRAFRSRDIRPLFFFVAAVGISALVDAVSWLAAWKYFSDFPRLDGSQAQWVTPYTAVANLLLPLKAIPKIFYGPGFMQRHEYNIFLGPVALYFAARGGWRAIPAQRRVAGEALLIFMILSLFLGFGRSDSAMGFLLPGQWFHAFWPGFQSIRVPVRFWFGAYLVLVLYSCLGFRFPKSRWQTALFLILGVLPLLANAGVNLSKTAWLADLSQDSVAREFPREIIQVHEHPDLPYAHIRRGQAVIDCTENLEIFKSASLVEGGLLQPTLSAPAEISTAWKSWNRISVEARSAHPLILALNLNYSALWRFEGAGAKISPRLRAPLTLNSPTGEIRGELVFEQPYVAAGVWVSGLSTLAFLGFAGFAFFPRRKTFRCIGLTGGIGSGKSTVSAVLRDAGIAVIDLDRIGREVTAADPDLTRQVVGLLGNETASGSQLNRSKIRELVFADPEKRRALEAILHPPIQREFEFQRDRLRDSGASLVVCEAALLVENEYYKKMDGLVVVAAPIPVRVERLKQRDGIDEILALKIIASQANEDLSRAVATVLIENDSDLETLRARASGLVEDWKKRRWL